MFLMFFVMMIMLLIFLNPGLFSAIGSGIGYVLSPVIGFDGRLPLMTILCASLIMSTISTLIRHHFINIALAFMIVLIAPSPFGAPTSTPIG